MLFRSGMIFSRPPFFPVGLSMAIELGIYGFVSGILYTKLKLFKNKTINIYFSLIIAMILGRASATLVNAIMYVNGLSKASFNGYLTILFIVGLPGIILQILIIPPVAKVVEKYVNNDIIIE